MTSSFQEVQVVRRLPAAATLVGVALALTPAAHAGTPAVAYTRVQSIGKTNSGTGSTQAPPINAEVATVDTGNSIDSTGVGTGFRKEGLYVSVLYENGSRPTGAGACLPAGKVNFGDRIIGAWVPDGATTRVLAPVTEIGSAYSGSAGPNTGGSLVGNWDHGTISVRRVDLIKPPTLYANLQACGAVHTTSTPTGLSSALWSNSLSDVDTLPSTQRPSIASLRQMLATPVNPIAPALTLGMTPTSVGAVQPPSRVRTVIKTVTKTVAAPGGTTTVTVPKVSTVTVPQIQTRTITTPPVTVTIPTVTTVTVPGL